MPALIGVLLAILAGLMSAPTIVRSQQAANQTLREIATAQEQVVLNDAAATYMQATSTSLLATATPVSPVIVSIPMLISANVLRPATFNAVNPYGQTWQLEVTQPTPGTLQGLVLAVGGTALSDIQTGAIAKAVGRSGGLIPLNDSGIYPGGAANAFGTAGNWQISTAGYTGVSGGHPASLVTLLNGQLANDYLYRDAVPGQPQVNTMNTDIHMAGNSLDAASSVAAVGVFASDATVSNTISAGGRLSTKEFLDVQGSAVVGAACAGPGLQSQSSDGTGTPLFCQSGTWATTKPNLFRFTFTNSTTWTVPLGVKSAFVSIAGGGVGGISGFDAPPEAPGTPVIMIGGASGGFAANFPVNLTAGQTVPITIGGAGQPGAYPNGGPGGTSCFGSLICCNGGIETGGEAEGMEGFCTDGSGNVVGFGTPGQYVTSTGGLVAGGQTPLFYGSGGADFRCNGCVGANPTVGEPAEPGVVIVDVLF